MAVGILFAASLAKADGQPNAVDVPALSSSETLDAWLAMPQREAPASAVVFLHGCSGLTFSGARLGIYNAWSTILTDAGYAVLMIDSAGSRGLGKTCGPGEGRSRMYRERPGDAYSGLRYLQQLPGIDPERIFLIGWSQGGGVALLTMNTESIGRPDPAPKHDFRGAVAFYPGKCASRLHEAPYTTVAPGTWATVSPILILHGGADNWTPAKPCQKLVEEYKGQGQPIEIIIYPDAVHAFDTPNMPVRARRDVTNSRGEPPLVGTNEAARDAAIKAVIEFLTNHR